MHAVGLHHHVVRPVEAFALEAVGDYGEAAVELLPRDPPRVVLAGDQPALQVASEAVGPVGRPLESTVTPWPGVYFMRLLLWMSLNRK